MDASHSDDRPDPAEGEPGDQPVEQDSPLGGDETTEEQLEADNPAEEEMLKTLDPGAPPA
ncbi:hypothetical protein ACFUTX_11680 [Microbacterium sp. NPDC057407]|uniref:hypothetical protein n=1 Tax=Microbacterium sp. NPDC057407 TaxID=3346120 RepID=UPI00366AD336